jgi:hypothetical protein
LARKFLYIVAVLILLVLAGAFVLRIWGAEITRIALVPRADFEEQTALAANAYADPTMWYSHPSLPQVDDPSRWQPAGVAAPIASPTVASPSTIGGAATTFPLPATPTNPSSRVAASTTPPAPAFALFFVHPTSYFESARWNAPLDDAAAQSQARLFLRGMASPFAGAAQIWAPRYRQATFGAMIGDSPNARRAVDAAHADVAMAFDQFLGSIPADMPIVLAGHSQGALHVLRLLKDKVAGTPVQARIAMVYPVGWPISAVHDLPSLGLPACEIPSQGGCIATWASFAEPAEPGLFLEIYRAAPGFDGQQRTDTNILCVNPLTGTRDGSAPASANLGTLKPNADLAGGTLIAAAVGARCGTDGLLLLDEPVDLGPYTLPGNNYHVYDIPLFWANVRADVARRVVAWQASR